MEVVMCDNNYWRYAQQLAPPIPQKPLLGIGRGTLGDIPAFGGPSIRATWEEQYLEAERANNAK
jgi:hypothetical protein